MPLVDIEWEDETTDIDRDVYLISKANNKREQKSWGLRKSLLWWLMFMFSLIWAAPFSLVAAILFLTVIGIPFAVIPWVIGCAPAVALINMKINRK